MGERTTFLLKVRKAFNGLDGVIINLIRLSLNTSKRKTVCYAWKYGNGNLINLSKNSI